MYLAVIGAAPAGSTSGGLDSDLHERRRANPVQELHVMPPAWRDWADVVAHLRRRASTGERHSRQDRRGDMPPWHADAPHGTFLNERGLTDQEKSTIFRWVANGAPKGDPKDMPPTPEYPRGWSIGTPDVVFEMAEEYHVPADDVVQYRILLHSDELHRTEMGAGDRGASGEPQRRAPRAGAIPGQARWAAHAPAEIEPGHFADASAAFLDCTRSNVTAIFPLDCSRRMRQAPIRRCFDRELRCASSQAASSNCRCITPPQDRTRPIAPVSE